MPMKNTTSKECGTCAAETVCVWTESVRNVKGLAETFQFACKYHIPRQSDSPKAEKTCDICGKPAEKLYECEKCHKMVCSNCVVIGDMLNINTGTAVEEILCRECEKGE